jgi:hypothetical protein
MKTREQPATLPCALSANNAFSTLGWRERELLLNDLSVRPRALSGSVMKTANGPRAARASSPRTTRSRNPI